MVVLDEGERALGRREEHSETRTTVEISVGHLFSYGLTAPKSLTSPVSTGSGGPWMGQSFGKASYLILPRSGLGEGPESCVGRRAGIGGTEGSEI